MSVKLRRILVSALKAFVAGALGYVVVDLQTGKPFDSKIVLAGAVTAGVKALWKAADLWCEGIKEL